MQEKKRNFSVLFFSALKLDRLFFRAREREAGLERERERERELIEDEGVVKDITKSDANSSHYCESGPSNSFHLSWMPLFH